MRDIGRTGIDAARDRNGVSAISENREVVDSVPEFPYACAIQYKGVRGRTLLPGSEWDRV